VGAKNVKWIPLPPLPAVSEEVEERSEVHCIQVHQAEGHSTVRVYSSPGGAVVATIPSGEIARCVDSKGPFLRVSWQKVDGWVGAKNTRKAQVEMRHPEGYPTVRVYSTPGSGAAVVAEIPCGEIARCIDYRDSFMRVSYQSIEGWVGLKNTRVVSGGSGASVTNGQGGAHSADEEADKAKEAVHTLRLQMQKHLEEGWSQTAKVEQLQRWRAEAQEAASKGGDEWLQMVPVFLESAERWYLDEGSASTTTDAPPPPPTTSGDGATNSTGGTTDI